MSRDQLMSDPKSLGHCPGEMPSDPIHPGHLAAVDEGRCPTCYVKKTAAGCPLCDNDVPMPALEESLRRAAAELHGLGQIILGNSKLIALNRLVEAYWAADTALHFAIGQAKAEEAARADAYRRAK